ncbi:MAG: Peptide chain release factor 1 [Myxococcota bacterium]|nr:Peptide chain release factor 1 [Myxococcota bacterium]
MAERGRIKGRGGDCVNPLFAKLEDVERRYGEMTGELSRPETVKDQKRFRELSREHAHMGGIVEAWRRFKDLRQRIAGNEELAADPGELGEMAREELESDRAALQSQEQNLRILLLPRDINDDRNVILEIRAGAGGDEAGLFAAEIFRMYSKYAERKGWRVEALSRSDNDAGGVKEIIAMVHGEGAWSHLKYESGVHRVQRVPATEAQGRIHTSTITVAVMPEANDLEVEIDEKELRIDIQRAGGPGGQSVNTTDSAVRITHIPTGIVVLCQDEKSQHKNKAKAMKILRTRLYELRRREEEEARAALRRGQVGTGERSEKIRTYNFPQSRLTDHRIGRTTHDLPQIMEGDLDELIAACRAHYQAIALEEAMKQ